MVETLRIHSKLPNSRANGPGVRAVIWLQGCAIGCPACFNPALHKSDGGRQERTDDLFNWLACIKKITGITISGGEPTEQLPGLLSLLKRIKLETNLSILLFSGSPLDRILSLPDGDKLVSLLDVLIDGPFDPKKSNPPGTWPSSANQKIHLLTQRYKTSDFSGLPDSEVIINERGEVMESGMAASTYMTAFRRFT